ncbi:hypothetical protein PENTCL1PPCAC_29812, partial [Pristionchus entomophagus]
AVISDMENSILIIPAFEMPFYNRTDIPKNKWELVNEWEEGIIRPFGMDNNNTDYALWKEAQSPFEVNVTGYESSIVVARDSANLYGKELVEFSLNNASHLTRLIDNGYRLLMYSPIFTVRDLIPLPILRPNESILLKCRHIFEKDASFER